VALGSASGLPPPASVAPVPFPPVAGVVARSPFAVAYVGARGVAAAPAAPPAAAAADVAAAEGLVGLLDR
jgi:hypothetical protein